MPISEKRIKKLQKIYRDIHGVSLSKDEAQAEGERLMKLVNDIGFCLATDPVAAKNAQDFCDLIEKWERERKDKSIKLDVSEKNQNGHMNSFSLG